MTRSSHAARNISYAHSASTTGGRAVIRLIENATGRIGLIRRAQGYEAEVARGRDFWQVMVERYGLELEVRSGSLDMIPRQGPLIVIANHPFGILDGLMLGHILSIVRGDFRILAHKIFCNAAELDQIVLPVSFDGTRDAVHQNLATRKMALNYLESGGCIGIFPGGTVSTAARPFSVPLDPGWRSFTAKMIAKSGAEVLPIYFDGHTSRLFQIASHMHSTLRMGLLIKEFRNRVDTPVSVAIGGPIDRTEIEARAKDSRALMDFLRKRTYALSSDPDRAAEYGYEFEKKHLRDEVRTRRY